MADDRYNHTVLGQEVQEADFNLLGKTSALADDRVLAEFLRNIPFDGSNVTKLVIPFGHRGTKAATVATSGSANGSVVVSPFRAIIGSRTTLAANAEKDNWRDVRSTVFAGVAGNGTLTQSIALTPNASGNARWDLIYATFTLDNANTNQVSRKKRDPSTGAVSTILVFQTISQQIAVQAQAGTPGSVPALPTIPADGGGNYYVPLAYVRVPNGFTSGSTVLSTDIFDAQPVIPMARVMGASTVVPANQSFKPQGVALTASRIATWGNTGTRPGYYLPPSQVGAEHLLVPLDLADPSSLNWSHQSLTVIDDSRDWSNRIFRWTAYAKQSTTFFAWDSAATPSNALVPQTVSGGSEGQRYMSGHGQSFLGDAAGVTGVANARSIVDLAPGAAIPAGAAGPALNELAPGTRVILYVDPGDSNKLKVFVSGQPLAKIFVWLESSAPFPSY